MDIKKNSENNHFWKRIFCRGRQPYFHLILLRGLIWESAHSISSEVAFYQNYISLSKTKIGRNIKQGAALIFTVYLCLPWSNHPEIFFDAEQHRKKGCVKGAVVDHALAVFQSESSILIVQLKDIEDIKYRTCEISFLLKFASNDFGQSIALKRNRFHLTLKRKRGLLDIKLSAGPTIRFWTQFAIPILIS